MKKLTLILFAVMAVFAGQKVAAQDKYGSGPNREECIKYLSYYSEYYKQKNYDSALPNWRQAYSLCPATASQNMFVHGTTLMTRLYNQVKDEAHKNAIVDTILTLQDQRMAAYPKNRVSILNNKGQYMINYRNADAPYIYKNLNEIVDELCKAFPDAVRVTGRDNATSKQQAVDSFQNGYSQLIICSIKK